MTIMIYFVQLQGVVLKYVKHYLCNSSRRIKTMKNVFCVLLLACSSSFAFQNLLEILNQRDSLLYCVENFVRQVFNRDRLIYYVSDGHAPMIIPQDGKNQYVIVNISKPIHLTLRHPGSYILHAENEASLKILTRKLQSRNMWNICSSSGAKYLTIISSDNVSGIFQILWENDITRVAVISINENRPKVHTSDPYREENHCGRFCKIYSTTECSSNKIQIRNTTRTYKNCCALFYYNTLNSITGRMGRFILTQFKRNFIFPIAIVNQRPVKVNCSIVFSIVSAENLQDLSEPIFTDNFCWATFVQIVSTIHVLQYVFDKWVWMMIASAFLAITVAWCLMLKFVNKKWNIVASLMNVWALSLIGSISNFPKPRCVKCLVLFYLLFITIIQTGFKTNLAQLLTADHYETGFNNINDLANSDRPLCTSELIYKKYINKTINMTNTYVKVKSKINTYPKRYDPINHKNCTSLIYWRDAQHYKNAYNMKIDYLIENFLTGPYNLYFGIKNGHQFKSDMNTFIKRLKENGIYQHLLLLAFEPFMNYKKLKEEETKLTILTLDHLYSFFVIWAIGLLISIVVFIFELVSKILEEKGRLIYYVNDGHAHIIIPKDGENQYVIVNINKPISLTSRYPGSYILHAKNQASLEILTQKLQSSNMWNVFSSRGAKYLTIISGGNVSDIFQILWKYDITRVAVISINKNSPKVYTSDPYRQENSCGRFCKIYSTTECGSNGIQLPKMTRTFQSCTAFFSSYQYPNTTVDHIARLILKQFARTFNLQITYEQDYKENNCIIAFSLVQVGNLEELTEPIFIDNFCWVTFVQKNSSIHVLQYVFDKWVWSMIATAFLVITLAWCLMLKFANKKWSIVKSLMNVWELSLLGCISNFPKTRSVKCLVLFYLLFIIIIQTGFKTNLAQLLTVDHYETGFNNINDLENSDRPLCTSKWVFKTYINKAINMTDTYVKVKSKINTYAQQHDVLEHKNCTALIYCRDAQYYKNAYNIKLDHFFESYLTGRYNLYFQIIKPYQFKSNMNAFIKMLKENGIYQHLLSKVFGQINKNKRAKEEKEETKLTVLTLDHVYSFFVIWAIGMLMSIMVFIFEILSKILEEK
ncbi:hypothetical protein FQA39_LY12014 [Lamprigera yunnana]|nr:hypothetical protein FQA39_LY12014 [Lamprigera yunnana]